MSLEAEAALRKASEEAEPVKRTSAALIALGVLGGGFLLTGLILIIAENWQAIPRGARIGGWALIQAFFLAAAHHLGVQDREHPYLSEIFAFLSCGWILGGIALVSQMYHLDSRPANGIWFWLILVLPAAWLLPRKAISLAVFVILVTGLSMEIADKTSLIHAPSAENPWLWMGVPLLAGALVSFLPNRVSFLPGVTGAWFFFSANLFLLVFGVSHHLIRGNLEGAWIPAILGFVLALAFPERVLPGAWGALTSRLAVATFVVPWVLAGTSYSSESAFDLLAVGLSWVIQFAIAILIIQSAAKSEAAVWVNLGYLAVLAGILTRYFDFFGEYLRGGVALTATGAVLLGLLFAIEKARRRTLRKGEAR